MLYPEESYLVQGALFEVYRELGPGFLEAVYHEALMREFSLRRIPHQHHPKLKIYYKGATLVSHFQPDFICFNCMIIELKATEALHDSHLAQVRNYLRATGFKLGLLANFGSKQLLEWKRIANSTPQPT